MAIFQFWGSCSETTIPKQGGCCSLPTDRLPTTAIFRCLLGFGILATKSKASSPNSVNATQERNGSHCFRKKYVQLGTVWDGVQRLQLRNWRWPSRSTVSDPQMNHEKGPRTQEAQCWVGKPAAQRWWWRNGCDVDATLRHKG